MTLSEFKAWLEGFGEAFDGAPTHEQWQKIEEKLASVQPDVSVIPTSYPDTLGMPTRLDWYTTCAQ